MRLKKLFRLLSVFLCFDWLIEVKPVVVYQKCEVSEDHLNIIN